MKGLGEVAVFIGLFCLFMLPGVIYYIYAESRPYCVNCRRRVWGSAKAETAHKPMAQPARTHVAVDGKRQFLVTGLDPQGREAKVVVEATSAEAAIQSGERKLFTVTKCTPL